MKKVLSVVLSLVMLLSLTAGVQFSAYADELPADGSCGENVTYTFDSSTGTLTLSGTGATYNYDWQGSMFTDHSEIKRIVINSGITALGDNLFRSCTGVTSVAYPDSVTKIGKSTFRDTAITEFTVLKNVAEIGEYAFLMCNALTSLLVNGNNTVYDSRNGCNAIIETAKDKLICGCANTVIPDSVKAIESFAFFGFAGITEVNISKYVESIGDNVFGACPNIASVTVSGENKAYDSRNGCNAIIDTNAKKLIFGCKNTVIPDVVKTIGFCAFDTCVGLNDIAIPYSVETIEEAAFCDCTGLTELSIPYTVTTIGPEAFVGCTNLKNVYYNGSEQDWNKVSVAEGNDALKATRCGAWSDGWTLYADVYVNGKKVNPNETIKVEKGSGVFVCFDTSDKNTDHGYAPLVGFSDGYEGGTLSSAGFGAVSDNASAFGLNYKDWGFGGDPMGSYITADKLPVGTKGQLNYFLYKCEDFNWATFDFITTPRGDIKTLNFVVTESKKEKQKTPAKTEKKKNTLTVKAKKIKPIKFENLKKKNFIIKVKKALAVKNAQGRVTYKKLKGSKKITVNKKTGKITVKKGLKKGTYKVKIKVTAAGNAAYKPAGKKVTVKITVN